MNKPIVPLWSPYLPPISKTEMNVIFQKQESRKCVATSLGMITGVEPKEFFSVGHNDPYEWSITIKKYGKKLVQCTTVPVTLKHYVDELTQLDDLFVVGLYLGTPSPTLNTIGVDDRSHLIVIYKNKVYDPAHSGETDLDTYSKNHLRVKRMFRVCPVEYQY